MRLIHRPLLLAALAAGAVACAVPAAAHPAHHRLPRHCYVPAPAIEERSVATVPQYERDGVPGNLPFNNQLRKFSDPLGANGR